ncbi:hypothetical protein [Streptomyces sp. NPDC002156]
MVQLKKNAKAAKPADKPNADTRIATRELSDADLKRIAGGHRGGALQ